MLGSNPAWSMNVYVYDTVTLSTVLCDSRIHVHITLNDVAVEFKKLSYLNVRHQGIWREEV